MAYILTASYETIQLIMGTVYPGARFETGGGQWYRYFLYPGNLFFVTSRALSFANTCELATFFDFFPSGMILALWVLVIEKQRDSFSDNCFEQFDSECILPCNLARLVGCCQFDKLRPAITGFLAIGFLNLLMLVRALALPKQNFQPGSKSVWQL